MGVKFEDNSDKMLKGFDSAINKALKKIGMAAVGYAQDLTPVVTGRLANSITYATKENEGRVFEYKDNKGKNHTEKIGTGVQKGEVYIGTNVEYAEGIELGTHRKAGAVHMIKKAATEHSDDYRNILETTLKRGT